MQKKMTKEMTKKRCDTCAKLSFCLLNYCFFEFLFANASSDRKVPIGVQNNGAATMLVYQDNLVAGS